MQKLKNIGVGFLISFIGSIPLGYLNVVGFEVYRKFGLMDTIYYLLGVISVELVVIYLTLLFANQLLQSKKLLQYIAFFSILFMFLIAYVFYSSASSESDQHEVIDSLFTNPPFLVGLLLSCFNFIQIPFWLGWNLFLLNNQHIEISNSRKYFYILGTLLGTFFGMLALILSLDFVVNQTDFFAKYLLKIIIPSVFVILGFFQGYKYYKKYFH
ncbi:hypothetical protein [Flavobacterium sp.]|uniref:hypothetical protein n=1 Tax=Flavobacterium sp. TaxID=239 RepID=UPI0025C5EC74|nr:hypothetical protein [Flavobacterium sp.]MBA4154104.1 hypothetical protein [Flavobacterium sp.]